MQHSVNVQDNLHFKFHREALFLLSQCDHIAAFPMIIAGAAASLAVLGAVSPLCSAYCQCLLVGPACRRRCDRVAALRAVPLFAVHAMLPLLFDGSTAAVVASLLAATLYTWWASMKVAALLLSCSGPLAEYADAPPIQFWVVFFLSWSFHTRAV